MKCKHCGKATDMDSRIYHREHCKAWNQQVSDATRIWERRDYHERKHEAFQICGCYEAWPAWWLRPDGKIEPCDCCHSDCKIARGEMQPIDKTRGILEYERESGWLRFMTEENWIKTRDAILAAASKCGIYNPWEIPGGWQAMVSSAVFS